MKFKCTSCSMCCRMVGIAINSADSNPDPDYRRLLKEFPHPINEDGSCSQLNEKGQCNVYEDRPLLCDIAKVYKKIISKRENAPTKKEYFAQNAKVCNKWVKEAGMPDSFLVRIESYQ